MEFLKYFKKKKSYCPWEDSEDPLKGKIFKHYLTGKKYLYLFAAKPEEEKKCACGLVVVYQNIETKTLHTCKWNNFFSTVKVDDKEVPRFEEIQ